MFVKECCRGKGFELWLVIPGGSTLTIPDGGEIPFNRIYNNNTKVRWFDDFCRDRFCEESHFVKFEENDTRAKTKLRGRYVMNGYVNIPLAATNVIAITDNEGQVNLNTLENEVAIFGSLILDEKNGTISIKNLSGVPIVLTPSATNPQVPVAKLIGTYEGR